ncbi:MAG: transcription-repair coupling factor [Anaerolineaceae bacterium]|nr:transcription-repair coupling factor [Anaerolineaceae bacterium]
MNLEGLLPYIRTVPAYSDTLNLIDGSQLDSGHIITLDIPSAARPPIIAALKSDIQRPILVLTSQDNRARILQDEALTWNSDAVFHHYSEPNCAHYQRSPRGPRTIQQRIATMTKFFRHHSDQFVCGVSSARALMTPTLPLDIFKIYCKSIFVGDNIRLNKLLKTLTDSGYTHNTMVISPGQHSRRGGILDIWPPADPFPTRIEFFGENIESMRRFDPSTQRSIKKIDVLNIQPARETLPKHGPEATRQLIEQWSSVNSTNIMTDHNHDFELLSTGSTFPELEYYIKWIHPEAGTLLDYLPNNSLIIVDNWQEFVLTVHEFEKQALNLRAEQIDSNSLPDNAPTPYASWSEIQDQLSRLPILCLSGSSTEPDSDLGSAFTPETPHGGQMQSVINQLEKFVFDEEHAIVVTRQAARLSNLWNVHSNADSNATNNDSSPQTDVSNLPERWSPLFIQGIIDAGFSMKQNALHILSDSEIFGWRPPEPRQIKSEYNTDKQKDIFFDFVSEDIVVHIEHGIGRFIGLVTRKIDNMAREYLHIKYAKGDTLYVPVTQADRLTRYVGPDKKHPSLSHLGGAEWTRARERTQVAVEEVAKELLELYAKRKVVVGHAFANDTPWQIELESSFPYIETQDQRTALEEIKHDMQLPRPMDRLICGDVGYGKTEVALRAAFKAVMDGKQVAVLVPTTVLAQQHYLTFQQRMSTFPVHIEMLSRFKSKAEQQDIITAISRGKVDIVIGTHRLVQADVTFNDLGLLIIDEEQRFGVTHKEYLKQLRTTIDVLTMTATPIPRTLYMTLTGARDISTINTAPESRLPVITQVAQFSKALIREAVLQELDRDGQIFFVHNRVETIDTVAKLVADFVPEVRIIIAHGQMPEKHLEKAMKSFVRHEYDLLVCTSIIESGLDIPNANTLIVDRADIFGLAQLYQLRGRVGRGVKRAYAYFLYHDSNRRLLSKDARMRLETVSENTHVGAGYSIAMRDLEMRGAGDMLGKRQHGHMAAVGFHLYTKLLRKAIKNNKAGHEKNNQNELPDWDLSLVSVELPFEVGIPSTYITDRRMRMQMYQRMAELDNEDSIQDIATELSDRFGKPPEPVENLIFQLKVKLLAHQAQIDSINLEGKKISLRCRRIEDEQLRRYLADNMPRDVRITRGKILLSIESSNQEWKVLLIQSLYTLISCMTARIAV